MDKKPGEYRVFALFRLYFFESGAPPSFLDVEYNSNQENSQDEVFSILLVYVNHKMTHPGLHKGEWKIARKGSDDKAFVIYA